MADMEAALAAYRKLCSLARADGDVCALEQRVLERYRRALGITKRKLRQPVDPDKRHLGAHGAILGSPQECAHAMRMMARVAWANGELGPREKKLLLQVAETLGIGALQFADILTAAETEAANRTIVHRRLKVGGSVIGAGLVLIGGLALLKGPSAAEEKAERERLARIERRLENLHLEDAAAAAKAANDSWSSLLQQESALARRVADLERSRTAQEAPRPGTVPADYAREIDALKAQLQRVMTARSSRFKAVEKEYRGSVLLIVTLYDLVKGQRRRPERSSGTGFFVSPDGIIATNKHVLQPWKFVPRLVKVVSEGYRVDPASVEIMAWKSGVIVQNSNGSWNRSTCFHNLKGTLAVLAVAPDTMEVRSRRLKTGGHHRGSYHSNDNSDLAVLKARVSSPVKALRLLTERTGVEKLDPVMIMGFPTGATILEDRRAENSASVGIVRKVEDTIFVDAPIVGGNSGGPALDPTGHVVGVATRTYGDASLGCCIHPSHLVKLLPRSRHFIDAAKELAMTHPDLALHSLDLAALRRPSEAETKEIAQLRSACEELRGRK